MRGPPGDIRHDLEYALRNPPVNPIATDSLKIGGKPPFPTNEGEIFSQYSINPGGIAA